MEPNYLARLISGIIWYEKGNCGISSSVCLVFYHSCDSSQTFCLSNQFTHFVAQDEFLKLRVYMQNTRSPPTESTSFQVALGALLIQRVAVVCLFLVLLQRFALHGAITELFIAVDYKTTVLWWCVCNHGYYHFSVCFSLYVAAVILLGLHYLCLIF